MTRNGAVLSKSAFSKQFGGYEHFLQESMTVITCFEMPLGFSGDVDGTEALLIFS